MKERNIIKFIKDSYGKKIDEEFYSDFMYQMYLYNQEKRHAQNISQIEKNIKNHLSYRYGQVILKNKNFIKWLLIPFFLLYEYRQWKKEKTEFKFKSIKKEILVLVHQDDRDFIKRFIVYISRLKKTQCFLKVDCCVLGKNKDLKIWQEKIQIAKISNMFSLITKDDLSKIDKKRYDVLILPDKEINKNSNEISMYNFSVEDILYLDAIDPFFLSHFGDSLKFSSNEEVLLEILDYLIGFKDSNFYLVNLVAKNKILPFYEANYQNKFKANNINKSLERLEIFYYIDKLNNLTEPKKQNNKICYILHNSFPYSSGGYATRAHGLACGLKNKGYDIHIITRPGYPMDCDFDKYQEELIPENEYIDGIGYHRLYSPIKKGMNIKKYFLKAAEEFEKIFLELSPSHVLAASNYQNAIPALIAARRLGIPFSYEVRGFWEVTRASREKEYEYSLDYSLYAAMETLTALYSDNIFTLTKQMEDELRSRGCKEKEITILPNSCDISLFEILEKDIKLEEKLNIPRNIPIIGYIGTFVHYEGLDDLAKACVKLKERNIEFRLLLVGSEDVTTGKNGKILDQIINIFSAANILDWLIAPGRVPHDQVSSYYSLIDIAPFPRKSLKVTEMVSPMKPLEAMAMGKAIIASSVGALSDMIIDNETGLIFKKGDIEDFAAKLQNLIEEKDKRMKLGINARHWVENNRTWRKTSEILLSKINK
ncbi:TPA: glycosyltransferase family 4 protein [Campylobacter lari]|nr:glycosyltransferase [Campylobacter lari]EGK8075722.1 glycosyltransferase [Campylobacter lari]MCV3488135.1 glycosyltransferase family 4 protein [Campylobacter lari]